MKRHRHTPEQAVSKLHEAERMLNEGTDLTDVLRHLEIRGQSPISSVSPTKRLIVEEGRSVARRDLAHRRRSPVSPTKRSTGEKDRSAARRDSGISTVAD